MNWDAIGAAAELLGALGVIATLGYLAVQIRQNTQVVRMSNFQELQRDYSNLSNTIVASPDAAMLFNKGLASFRALSEDEKARFHWMISEPLKGAQTCFQLHRRGLIDESLYENYMTSFLRLFRAPGVREYWSIENRWWHDDFQAFLNTQLEKRESGAPSQIER